MASSRSTCGNRCCAEGSCKSRNSILRALSKRFTRFALPRHRLQDPSKSTVSSAIEIARRWLPPLNLSVSPTSLVTSFFSTEYCKKKRPPQRASSTNSRNKSSMDRELTLTSRNPRQPRLRPLLREPFPLS